jgi:hypothetical protein
MKDKQLMFVFWLQAMSEDFLQAWDSALQLISKAQAASSTACSDSSPQQIITSGSLVEVLGRLDACKPAPATAWHKLVEDMQVICTCMLACLWVHSLRPRTGS